jgi:multidrug efflux pump subunit AcrB
MENVEQIIAEEGLPPREVRSKSMGQIQNAIIDWATRFYYFE